MRLYNYKLNYDGSGAVQLRGFGSYIRLPGTNYAINNQVIFATPLRIGGPFSARQHLALSFAPKYRLIMVRDVIKNYNIIDNEGSPVSTSTKITDLKRVWPAFGQIGCGREVVILNSPVGKSNRISVDKFSTFGNGGATSSYHQDTSTLNKLWLQTLSLIIYDFYMAMNVERPENKEHGAAIKVLEEIGVVLKFYKTQTNYSISSGYNEFLDKVVVKFWAYCWVDDEFKRERKIVRFEESVEFQGFRDVKTLACAIMCNPSGTEKKKIDRILNTIKDWIYRANINRPTTTYTWPKYFDKP